MLCLESSHLFCSVNIHDMKHWTEMGQTILAEGVKCSKKCM